MKWITLTRLIFGTLILHEYMRTIFLSSYLFLFFPIAETNPIEKSRFWDLRK